jgi:2-polyprenyl-3-methyl-5-hydroxy-6-metoxy-1,4-benzoquinol methylase
MDCAARPGTRCDYVSLGHFIDRSRLIGEIEVRQCRHCRHAISLPPLPDVAFLYDNRESQDYQPDVGNPLVRWIKEIAFRRQARTMAGQIGNPGSEALDFGCGSGQFTRILGDTLKGTRLTACDFFETPPAELEGRPYLPTQQLEECPERFDLVIASHVLEHDDDAAGLLAKIVYPAKKGGTVVLEVPNVECVWGRLLGRYWDAWYLPYHRHHYSRGSLIKLLEDNGLAVESVYGITAPTMGRTLANVFGKTNNVFWVIAGIVLHPLQIAGEWITGQRTALRVVARKL